MHEKYRETKEPMRKMYKIHSSANMLIYNLLIIIIIFFCWWDKKNDVIALNEKKALHSVSLNRRLFVHEIETETKKSTNIEITR